MNWLTDDEILLLGLARVGANVKIGRFAILVNSGNIEIGDNSRIDDFTTIIASERGIEIGNNVHIGSHSHLAGAGGIVMHDFSGLSQGVRVYTASDDYTGASMTNPTVPSEFKRINFSSVIIGKHAIAGSNSVIMPGCDMGEGSALGALSLLTKKAEPWGVYFGSPARKIKQRKKDLLELEQEYLKLLNTSNRH